MKFGPGKVELRIHRGSYGPLQCNLASPAPGTAAKFRRWNVVLIAILVFLVFGAFVAAEAPRTASDTNARLKSTGPVSVQHANSSKSDQPAFHSRGKPGSLSKDVMSGHHTT